MKKAHKIVILSSLLTLAIGSFATVAIAQTKATTKKAPVKTSTTGKITKMANGFSKLPSGLEYKVVKHGTGTVKPRMTDHIELNIHLHVGDSVIFDSRKMNNNSPVPLTIGAPKFKGDP